MRIPGLLLATIAAITPASAGSDLPTATPVLLDDFVETFDDTSAVSGSALVGLSIGSFASAVDVSDVRIIAPSPSTAALCVRVTTLDGRFSASNLYVVPSGATDAMRLSTVTRRFEREVAGYRPRDLAIRAYVSGDVCSPRNALHLPQMQPDGGTTQLVVQVNSSTRRTTARLTGPDGDILSAACVMPETSALIAFDKICYIDRPLGASAGTYTLELDMYDGFGNEVIVTELYLPQAS